MTARSCLYSPGHLTGGAANSHECLVDAQRLPVIQLEVVVVLAMDCSTIDIAAVDELEVLQPCWLTKLICGMIDSRS
jgi:hypothetical protein